MDDEESIECINANKRSNHKLIGEKFTGNALFILR